ncbi:MAG: UDP-N-acetylmuramoyl-L-alanyl-D-glutamate--2,6-diaminopimelate ligase, partial [Bacteroidales bacterium]|nr:UDP-N-acetylmuramoyl-L-alanyl-D-glutamate--2,6-diaminopimelate ligase [Bacteroidales bacterium]
MKLSTLLERLSYRLGGSKETEIEIKSIEQDSRKVQAGSLFVAVRGTNVDGHS